MKTILHLINQSPFETFSLEQCLARYQVNDSLLLIEDGVYAAISKHMKVLENMKAYAIKDDVNARGLMHKIDETNITLIDYQDFVDLTISHDLTQSWY